MQLRPPFLLSVASLLFVSACAGSTPPAAAPPMQASPPPAAASPSSAAATAETSLDPRGVRLVDALAKGDWNGVETLFAPSLQKAISSQALGEAWVKATANLGAFQGVATTRAWANGDLETVVSTVRFERGFLDVKGSAKRAAPDALTGIFFNRADASVRALPLLTAFVHGDLDAIYGRLDDRAKAEISREKLATVWKAVIDGVGVYDHFETTKTQTHGEAESVTVTTAFAKQRADIIVTFVTGSDRISGFRILPVAPPSPPPDAAPPSYARPETYEEQPALVGKGDRALPATLTMPKGKGAFPAVILVHGSGSAAGDRDETILAQRPFRDIALGLASRGIAVLRYEKRTYGNNAASLAAVGPHLTIKEEAIDDALEAVRVLRASPHIDGKHVYVVGHSEGGMLAPLIAEGEPSVAGIVVLAGPARPFEDVLLEQVTRLAAAQGAEGKAKLDELTKKIARVKSADLSPETPSSELPLDVPASYWLSLRGYDPVAHAAKLAKPILVLRGDQDAQVAHLDFTMWQDKLGKSRFATLAELPGLSHAFVDAPYDVPHHVSEAAVTKIADWILARR